jgi:caffeyl-CoA reductase-Etf complex subunit CarE
MENIYIIEERCNGCRKCIKICSYKAINPKGKKVHIDVDKCTLCNACIKVCEKRAIIIPKKAEIPINEDTFNETWIFIEAKNGLINPLSLQILSKGYELAKKTSAKLTAVLILEASDNIEEIKKTLGEHGAEKIKILVAEGINNDRPEDFCKILSEEISNERPEIVLFLGTSFGRELAPRIAARLKVGITADCTTLQIDENKNLVQVRPTYGGKILATILSRTRPQIASVRPNIFSIRSHKDQLQNVEIEVKNCEVDSIVKIKKIIKTVKTDNKNLLIDDAEVVVCGGLGMGSKRMFKQLEIFANKIGGALGATRAAVDLGWIDFSSQIGQTGKIVRPRLYVGFGVSGAIHHLIGMKNSHKIISINNDERAPILRISDLGIICNIEDILPELIESA